MMNENLEDIKLPPTPNQIAVLKRVAPQPLPDLYYELMKKNNGGWSSLPGRISSIQFFTIKDVIESIKFKNVIISGLSDFIVFGSIPEGGYFAFDLRSADDWRKNCPEKISDGVWNIVIINMNDNIPDIKYYCYNFGSLHDYLGMYDWEAL